MRKNKIESQPLDAAKPRVAYFVDTFAEYNRPEIAISALKLLERCGVGVVIPPQKSSGMPYFSYGGLRKLRKIAEFNVKSMLPHVRNGCEVVTTEPTAAYCFKQIYPKLLGTEESKLVAEHTCELCEYLANRTRLREEVTPTFSFKAGFHISCHQRAMSGGSATVDLMKAIGIDAQIIETGTCCGMGGTVGLKKGVFGYELSNEVGKPLFELFTKENPAICLTESSVCTLQLEQGTKMNFEHPVILLAKALRKD
jgi:glycerol-3-phosphate dehydrogenase subunit C